MPATFEPVVVNSVQFFLFFTAVFILYYLPVGRRSPRWQNGVLLVASYAFYALADWRMTALLLGSTAAFWGLGAGIGRAMERGRERLASRLTTLAVALGVGVLVWFKYLDFFASQLCQLLSAAGLHATWTTLHVVMPVGVSFFTFKLMSYAIEVHRRHIEPCRNAGDFAVYIAFFPTIMSGPIDRPGTFLPQLRGRRAFDYDLAVDGARQVLWGLFMKMVVADNLAAVTDPMWASCGTLSGPTLLVGALVFPIRLYADFAAYSDMAIGVAKLLGLRVTRNFNHPLIARNIADYWRRWHMSLTSWITDYVFMPLNLRFRDWGKAGTALAVVINLVVIGLWHGANWTYAVFGLYHGLLFIPLIASGSWRRNRKLQPGRWGLPTARDLGKMAFTYCLVALGLVIFQAPSLHQLGVYLTGMVTRPLPLMPHLGLAGVSGYLLFALWVLVPVVADWRWRDREHPLQFSPRSIMRHEAARLAVYALLTVLLIRYTDKIQTFLYFQF